MTPCGCRELYVPGGSEQEDLLPAQGEHLLLGSISGDRNPQYTKWQALENGCVSLVTVFSIDSWDLGEKKTNFYFLDYKFVILGIVAFV